MTEIKCGGCGATTVDPDKWDPDADTGEVFCDPCWEGCYHCGARRRGLRPYLAPSMRVCENCDLRPAAEAGRDVTHGCPVCGFNFASAGLPHCTVCAGARRVLGEVTDA